MDRGAGHLQVGALNPSGQPATPSLAARVAAGETEFVDEEFGPAALRSANRPGQLRATDTLEFDGCRFVGVTLAGATIRHWVLRDCVVEAADLTGADLASVEVADVRLVECKALGVDWSYLAASPITADPVTFERCRLAAGTFRQLDQRRWTFQDCDLTDSVFDQADLRDARLIGCDLTGATFTGCDLRAADLTDSHGYCFDVRANRVTGMVVTALDGAELLRPFGIGPT